MIRVGKIGGVASSIMEPESVSLHASCLERQVVIQRSIRLKASGESDAGSSRRPMISQLAPAGLSDVLQLSK